MSKKIWSAPVALVVVVTIALFFGGITVSADEVDSGSCGESATWSLDSNGTLTISGSGEMYDYQWNTKPWSQYKESIYKVVIENGITNISSSAFSYLGNVETVSIASSVTAIKYEAFNSCRSLTSIDIPSSVTRIEGYAFQHCTSLTTVKIPASVTSLGDYVFSMDSSITTVTFGANSRLTVIPESAFGYCTELTTINLPESVTTISSQAFNNCKKMQLTALPGNTETVAEYAFQNCQALTSLDLGTKLTVIGEKAFKDCTNLETVNFPDTLKTIDVDAFRSSGLTSLTLSSGIESIYNNAFANCKSLKTIDITIANDTFLDEYIFTGCTALETATIKGALTVIPVGMFNECTNLNSVSLPDSITEVCDSAFNSCVKLSVFNWPANLTTVGNYAFCYTGLTSATIRPGVTYGISVYSSCGELTSVTIAEGVTTIPEYTFSYCSKLETINFPDSLVNFGNYAFSSTGLKSVSLELNDTEEPIIGLFSGCSQLESATITGSITKIGESLFGGCEKLKSFTIPENVTYIGSQAFSGCESLSSITIPGKVETIDSSAFADSGLTSIVVPENVTSIGNALFYRCRKLTSVTLPNNITALPSSIFSECDALTSFTIPANIKSIGYMAFSYSGLEHISIPGTVELIENGAFESCRKLRSAEICEGVQHINGNPFYGCTVLETAVIGSTVDVNDLGSIFNVCENIKTIYCTAIHKTMIDTRLRDVNFIIIDSADTIGAHIIGHSITLSADIGVNFYVALPVGYDSSNTQVTFTWGSAEDNYAHSLNAKLTPVYENGANFMATCGVAARAMSDTITMVVKSGKTVLMTDEYSVMQYVNILAKTYRYDYDMQRLLTAMFWYGHCSQTYFKYHEREIYRMKDFDTNYDVEEYRYSLDDLEVDEADMTIRNIANDDLGLSYYGTSLLCTSQAKLRFYFRVTDATAFAAVKESVYFKSVNLKFVDKEVNGENLVYIETQGLMPGDLQKIFEIKIGDKTYRYDYKDYMQRVKNIDNGRFEETAKYAYAFSYYSNKYQEGLKSNG